MWHLQNIFWLGTKELRSFMRDYFLLGLVIYTFSFAIYAQAGGTSMELHNAAIAIADLDRSDLSREIAAAFLPPYFKPAVLVDREDTDRLLDVAAYTFILEIPPHFARDVASGHAPAIQVNVDATAAMQAGIGAGYIGEILQTVIARAVTRADTTPASPVNLVVHIAFNPNVTTAWFSSIMAIIGNINVLAIILAGAALIREREHGTMDHLMVMPLAAYEIMLAKVWANALVITVAVAFSLAVVVRLLLAIPIAGSIPLFMIGVVLYLFFATAIGIFLGTVAQSMPQLGLLYMLVALPMNMLSGGNTPLDSMPMALQWIMQISPSTHLVSFAQAILFRGAGFAQVWLDFLVVAVVGGAFFGLALRRFGRVVAAPVG